MLIRKITYVALLGVLCAGSTPAQSEIELTAKGRSFPEFGPGLTGFKRDAAGRYFILAARSGAVAVFSADGKRVGQIPSNEAMGASVAGGPAAATQAAITYGAGFDLDAEGNVYVADQGAGVIKVFSPSGALLRTVAVTQPTGVAVLPEGEIAVTSAAPAAPRDPNPRLISVYNARGKLAREFGDPVEVVDRKDVNRLLGVGRILSDPKGHLFYAYTYLPEPTLRRYDRFGYTTLELELATLEFQANAQSIRRELKKQDEKTTVPALRTLVNAVGFDPESDDIWLACGNVLLHFDKEGSRRGTYRIFTNEGARLEPVAIVVESERLLIASDPLGIFEFPRPDKPRR